MKVSTHVSLVRVTKTVADTMFVTEYRRNLSDHHEWDVVRIGADGRRYRRAVISTRFLNDSILANVDADCVEFE